jgi:hypothetical protein
VVIPFSRDVLALGDDPLLSPRIRMDFVRVGCVEVCGFRDIFILPSIGD